MCPENGLLNVISTCSPTIKTTTKNETVWKPCNQMWYDLNLSLNHRHSESTGLLVLSVYYKFKLVKLLRSNVTCKAKKREIQTAADTINGLSNNILYFLISQLFNCRVYLREADGGEYVEAWCQSITWRNVQLCWCWWWILTGIFPKTDHIPWNCLVIFFSHL